MFCNGRPALLPRQDSGVNDTTVKGEVQAPAVLGSEERETQAPSATPEPEVLPLVLRPSIRDVLARSHWHTLLSCSELQLELQHHCPFCRQWCMDTAAIKRHMTQQHPEWVAKFSRVVQALTTFRRTVVFPCRYLAHTLAHLYRLASLLFPGARQSRMTEMFEDLDMSAQERLFYGGVCPSLQQVAPKREREEGFPDWKKARLEQASSLGQGSTFVGLVDAPGSAKGKGTPKGGQRP